MEKVKIIPDYLKRFRKTKRQNKNQVLASEIYKYFGGRLEFSRIMKMIKNKGYQFIYEIFQEVKRSNPKNRLALFLWKFEQQPILWKK